MVLNKLFASFVLGIINMTATAAVYDPILAKIKPGTITIIGETHKKPESIELFQNLTLETIKSHRCVVVGLEIASDQQLKLDAIMQGGGSVRDIAYWPAVDHPFYRRMIETFAEHWRQGQCIKVIAIDSGLNNAVDRDLWMALSLAENGGDSPVLVLLGALHTLKHVDWKNATGRASVAEILTTWGFSVNSYAQRWSLGNCANNRTAVFVSDHSPQALEILNGSLMTLINSKPHKSATGIVDGFVIWKCKKENIKL
jgi:uncharacterized iron-regulated protein